MTDETVDRRTVQCAVEPAGRAPSVHHSQPWRGRIGAHNVHRYPRAVAVAALLAVLTAGCGQSGVSPASGTAGPTAATPGTTGPVPPGTPTASAPTPTSRPAAGFAYQLLYPFADAAGVRAWQDAYRAGGHQPWHLDAEATALSFARDHLGFTEIDRVRPRSSPASRPSPSGTRPTG